MAVGNRPTISTQALPPAESATFLESAFFSRNGPGAELPSPANVREQGTVQDPTLKGRNFGFQPVRYEHLSLIVKYGRAPQVTVAEGQLLWALRRVLPTVPVPEVYGWTHDNGQGFIYMELVKGVTLEQRYLRAFEAGRNTTSVKYEVHVKLRTKRDGPVIRNQIRLPHAVRSDLRVCVICPEGSRAAKEAKAAGADIVGEQEVFDAVKAGKIDFDVCICHTNSLQNLNKAGLGRVLGPRGLMPSAKMGTVVDNVATTVRNMRGGSIYRERSGVVKLAIGQLGFSPEELKNNLGAFITAIKKDAAGMSDQVSKDIAEVVLSTTNGPGFSLNGEYKSESSPPMHALTGC
ncbi:hypothetical protein McanMca71_000937 [Microsporum canis]